MLPLSALLVILAAPPTTTPTTTPPTATPPTSTPAATTPTTTVALQTVEWAFASRAADVVVAPLRTGVCLQSWEEACGPVVVDRDQRVLRGVSLSSGKLRWQSERHPVLLGAARLPGASGGARRPVVVAASRDGGDVAVLDAASGAVVFGCVAPFDDDGSGAAFAFARGASDGLWIERRYDQRGGAARQPPAPLLLTLTTTGCALSKSPGAPVKQAAPVADADDVAVTVGSNKDGTSFVETAGTTPRRVRIDVPAHGCKAWPPCQPIP